MNLTELAFKVDSSQLLEAKQALQGVAGALTDVAKAEEGRNNAASKSKVKEQAKDADKLTEAESKVTKALEHQNKMLKYTEAGYTKVQARQLALAEAAGASTSEIALLGQALHKVDVVAKSNNKTTEQSVKVQKEHTSVTQKQKDVLDFMSQGFSKGQSSVLAHAKALQEDTQALGEVLQAQRKLTGAEPFDKSLSGLIAMNNQYRQMTEVIRQVNHETGLTTKQAENLSRDKQRLFESWKNSADAAEGSVFSVRTAMRELEQQYVASANQVNRLVQEEKKHQQAARETASAIKYLATEDEKMAASLNTVNANLDKASTDKLVKYENALKKAGLTQDLQTKKMQVYRTELQRVQAQEAARAEQHLARALSPQITDIGVSLWSGQNPLTVLIQQGGQVVDLFRLSGIEANKMGQAMTNAFMGMIPSIAAVGKGVAELAGNLLMMPVNALTTWVKAVPPVAKAFENVGAKLNASAAAGNTFALAMIAAGNASKALLATGLGAVLAVVSALAVGYVQAVKEQDAWVRALYTGNNLLNLTSGNVQTMSVQFRDMGYSSKTAADALIGISNNSKLTASDINLVMQAALDLEKFGGVAVEETVKRYSQMREKPVDAMLELIKTTGDFSLATLDTIESLNKKGDAAGAAAYALEQMAERDKKTVQNMKVELNEFALFAKDLAIQVNNFFASIFKDISKSTDSAWAIVRAIEQVDKEIATFEGFALRGLFPDFGEEDLSNLRLQRMELQNQLDIQQMQADVQAKQREDNRVAAELRIKATNSLKEQMTQEERLATKRQESVDLLSKLNEASTPDYVAIEAAGKALSGIDKQLADIAEKSSKTKLTPDEKGLELYKGLIDQASGYTREYHNQVELLNASLKSQKINQEQYNEALKVLNSQQPLNTKAKRDATKAEKEHEKALEEQKKALESLRIVQGAMNSDSETVSERILKVQSRITKEYQLQPKAIKDTLPPLEEMLNYAVDTDKAVERYRENLEKITLEHKHQLEAISEQSSMIDDQLKIAFMNTEDAKNYTREKEKQVKHAKALRDYEKAILDIRKQLKGGDPKEINAKELEAYKVFTAEKQLIDQEYTSEYTKDFIKEFQSAKSDITDVISTALFEGGKAGREKLKDILKQRLIVSVTASIDNVVGQGLQMLMGGGSSAVGGGSGGNVSQLGSGVGGQLLNSMTGGAGVGGLIAGVGGMLNIGGITAFGSGMAAGGSLGLTAGLSQGAAMIGSGAAGSTAAGLGTMLGAVGPWAAAAMALYTIAKSFDNSGTLHYGAGAIYNQGQTQQGQGIYNRATFGMGGSGEYNASAQGNVTGIAQALGSALDTFAKGFGKEAGYTIATAFADDSSEDGAWGSLRIADAVGRTLVNWEDTRSSKWAPKEFADGDEGYQQYLNAIAADVKSAFLSMDLPTWANNLIQATDSLDTLNSALTSIAGTKALFEALGKQMKMFNDISDEAQSSLIKYLGSTESLANAASGYYQNFYSEAERMQTAREQVNSALKSLGVSLGNEIDVFNGDKAKEQFRKHIEEAMQTGQVELASRMLELSSVFAEVADYASNAEGSITRFAGAIEKLTNSASSLRTAGELLDGISAAMGKSKSFAQKWEKGLWSTLGKGTAEQTISVATDLFGIVQQKIQAEQQAYNQQIQAQQLAANEILNTYKSQYSWAQAIKDYVSNLTLGDKSPLTTAQKLAEASKQYSDTLAKAKSGDEKAASQLTGIADSYLELARTYYASGDTYTSIFNSVTSQLGTFSAAALSEAERQIAIQEQQLLILQQQSQQEYMMSTALQDELRKLYDATEQAYLKQETEHIKETDLLYQQITALGTVSEKLNVLGSINYSILALSGVLGNALFSAVPKIDGSHAGGLANVPFNGYVAELHQGERVLTAQENRSYSQGSSFNDREIKALRQDVKNLQSALVQAMNNNTRANVDVTKNQTGTLVQAQEKTARQQALEKARKALA